MRCNGSRSGWPPFRRREGCCRGGRIFSPSDRERGVWGKGVGLGGRRLLKKKAGIRDKVVRGVRRVALRTYRTASHYSAPRAGVIALPSSFPSVLFSEMPPALDAL